MQKNGIAGLAALVAMLSPCVLPSAYAYTTALSPAQQQAIGHAIGQLHGQADRNIASQWSDAKKVAEVMCRPLALEQLRRADASIDRVFLGDNDPGSLSLTSNTLLDGRGQARAGNAWKTFTFACRLDPAAARATGFDVRWDAGN